MIELNVNGSAHSLDIDPEMPLLWALREHLRLTGTKYGCGIAQCGSCTVYLDGEPIRSCITPVSAALGKQITTIEGLLAGEELGPTQQAFLAEDALQCGYCTPGQIMAAEALLREHPRPTREEIEAGMAGNLCRCGAYPRIVASIETAAKGRS